jgi:ferredoxin--NADP+ reductase
LGIEIELLPKSVTAERVLDVRHWTDRLFSFRITRPPSFRFRSGEFVMIGLMNGDKPLLRAYSIASPSWDDALDFFSIKVPDGPLTSRLQNIRVGDTILLGKKPTGTLVLDALKPGRNLYMLSTGTGVAPFASVIRDPETYENFDQVILTQTCREVAELAYAEQLVKEVCEDPLVGEQAARQLRFFASATREDYVHTGRITDLIENGKFFEAMGTTPFNPEHDRVMICGSMEMIRDVKALTEKAGLVEGANSAPGDFVVEKAFAG